MEAMTLSDAIKDLRAELTRALEAGHEEVLKFDVGSLELELQLGYTAGSGVNAGAKWWVLSAGAETTREQVHTHTLKIALSPRLGDESLRIAGRSLRPAEEE